MADLTDQQLWGPPVAKSGGVSVWLGDPSQQPQQGQVPPPGQGQDLTDAQLWGATQAPGAPTVNLKPDEWLGFQKGFMTPFDNASHWVENGMRAIPGGAALDDALQHGASAIGMPTDQQSIAAHQQAIADAAAHGRSPGPVGQFLGNVAGTLPVAFATKNPWLTGAGMGALGTDSPDDPGRVALDAGFGAIGGKAGEVATNALGHVISPVLRPAVQMLRDSGVQMTPGQILGGGAQRIEDSLTHLPLIGGMIKNAQANSVHTFNQAAINRSLAPIGEALPTNISSGRNAIDYAAGKLSDAYGALAPKLTLNLDQDYAQGLAQALQQTKTLPETQQKQFTNIVKNNVLNNVADDGAMSGAAMQAADSKLGHLTRSYGSSQDPDQRGLADALSTVQDSLRDMAARQNPQYADAINGVRTGWANLVRTQGAAASQGAKEGVFTPAQLANAVRGTDSSVRKNAFARGDALMQDLSDAGQSVLPSTVPDSGTALRGLAEAGVLGMGAHEMGVFNPTTLAAGATLAAPYTKPGLAASRYLLAGNRPSKAASLARAVQGYGQPVSQITGSTIGRRLAEALMLSGPSQSDQATGTGY